MKKLTILLLTLSLFACSNDDTTKETHEFRDRLVSSYKLQAVYTDTPIDLNGDGALLTDLWAEADCFAFHPFGLLMGEFNYNEREDYKHFWIDMPYSYYDAMTGSYTTCIDNKMVFYNYDVNEETKKIIITHRNEEIESEYGTLTDIKWENDVIHFTFSTKLYTTDGWQPVTLHLKYLKWDFSANN